MADENLPIEENADADFDAGFAEEVDEQPGAPAQNASGEESGDEVFDAPEKSGPQEKEQIAEPAENSADEHDEVVPRAHYNSMLGRLQAEQRKARELEDRLAKLEQAPPEAKVEVPEELKTEIEELTKRDPQLAAIVLEDSKDGERLRKGLEEYGVDYAEERADTIRMRREVHQTVASVQSTAQNVVRETKVSAFYAAVAEKHKDWVDVVTDPARRPEYDAYMKEVRTWAESLPYAEGAKAFRVMEQGTPTEVVGLLDRFKEAKNGGGNARKGPSAEDALAVPSRSGPPPSKKIAAKDDFDAAFDEAPEA
jgi:hypothetical protein